MKSCLKCKFMDIKIKKIFDFDIADDRKKNARLEMNLLYSDNYVYSYV